MGSVPVGVPCLLTSSLGEFLGYWAGSGILGYHPGRRPSPFPSPSISRCFSIHPSLVSGFHSCFSFTADVSAPIRSTLHLLAFQVSFHAWNWISNRCCGP